MNALYVELDGNATHLICKRSCQLSSPLTSTILPHIITDGITIFRSPHGNAQYAQYAFSNLVGFDVVEALKHCGESRLPFVTNSALTAQQLGNGIWRCPKDSLLRKYQLVNMRRKHAEQPWWNLMKRGGLYIVFLECGRVLAVCLKRNVVIDSDAHYPHAVSYVSLPVDDDNQCTLVCDAYKHLLGFDPLLDVGLVYKVASRT